jgi:hypothetical protein
VRGHLAGKAAPMDEATITPYRDGPLLVRGPFRLLDQDGGEIEVVRFRAPSAPADRAA